MATLTIRTVASYYTHEDYSVDFFGAEFNVTVTKSPSVIRRWISNVFSRPYSSHPLVIGVGVQWTALTNPSPGNYYDVHPPFDPSPGSYYSDPPLYNNYTNPPTRSYNDLSLVHHNDPPADTLQLCVGKQCLIIQLSHCDYIPYELRNFLTDPEATHVGVWNSQDAGKLDRCRHRLEIRELLDIRHYIKDFQGRSLRPGSFEQIVEECIGYHGVRLDPEISLSDWSVYDLCHDQILQASVDVYVCSELGVWLRLWEV